MSSFVHLPAPHAEPATGDRCLVIQGDRLVARAETISGLILPTFGEMAPCAQLFAQVLHLGSFEHHRLWACEITNTEASLPEGWRWHETPALLTVFTPAHWQAVSCARELLWWERRHRFCGACGTATIPADSERARRCPKCDALFFPVVSSAVIVAVTRGDEILLAHNRNFRPGMVSLLAGFVDAGETLEQAAVREVREEVGIDIAHVRYITSQPWPFPNSLMMGFRAEHARGEIVVDGKEIEHAAWYRRDAMPEIPRAGTVARYLIDQWLKE